MMTLSEATPAPGFYQRVLDPGSGGGRPRDPELITGQLGTSQKGRGSFVSEDLDIDKL